MTRLPLGSRARPPEGARCDAPIIATDLGFMSGVRSRQRDWSPASVVCGKPIFLSTVVGSVAPTGRSLLHSIAASCGRVFAMRLSVQVRLLSDSQDQMPSVQGYQECIAECHSGILHCGQCVRNSCVAMRSPGSRFAESFA